MPKTILVTGCAGFIGYHVAENLLQQNISVAGIDNMNNYYDVSLKEARLKRLQQYASFSFHKEDIADHDTFQKRFSEINPTHVVHLAAQAGVRHSLDHPRAYTKANIDGFLSVLEACRHMPVEHLIYASSSSVYGSNTKVPFSENDDVSHPISLYAATKRANELMAETYSHLYNLAASGLRFFTVYGPWGRPDMALFKFAKAIFDGQPIDVYNHGKMQRDFTYVDDIVEAIVRLLDCKPAAQNSSQHKIYNIGNHTPVALEYFISVLEKEIGKTAIKNYLPMQPGDVPATFAEVSALSAAVDFAPRTKIDDGIKSFIAWYRAYYRT